MRSNCLIARPGVAFTLAAVFACGQVSAAPIALQAQQAATPASSFSLDFGVYGGISSANISQTDFELEIDADQGTAQFVKYEQFVQPLILPGGFSTGNIRVEIVPGSSQGELDTLAGEFATTEHYAVHFDGDLSAFGLTSPVILPSASAGTVRLSAVDGGKINMDWAGIGYLPNPFAPGFIEFRYTCSVAAAFSAEPVSLLQLALIPDVINLTLPVSLERNLLGRLERALGNIEDGFNQRAVALLDGFISKVEAVRGINIPAADADVLISDAEGAILLLGQTQARGGAEAVNIISGKGGSSR